MTGKGKRPPMRPDLRELLTSTAQAGKAVQPSGTLPLTQLRPGTAQPRRTFDEVGLQALAASLRERGVLQPLLVRPAEGGYEIVAGERRWRAAQLAGLMEVPVAIRDMTDQEARVAALVENLQREDLNLLDEVDAKLELVATLLAVPRDEARARLLRLAKAAPGSETEQLDALFGPLGESWRTFAKNKLRVLNWPAPLLDALRGGLPFTLGAVIAGAPEGAQAHLIQRARGGASRAELRAEIARLQSQSGREGQTTVERLGQRLSSRRWLNGLSPADQKAIEKWVARMPTALRAALEED